MSEKTYEITITIAVPDHVGSSDVEAWARYETGNMGGMDTHNPLSHTDFEAKTFRMRPLDY